MGASAHGPTQNNAGWEGPTLCPEPTGFPSIDDDTLIKINAINMTGPLLCTKYAVAEMLKNGEAGGIIIGNSSVAEVMPADFAGMLPIYHPTKAYMGGLTRSINAAHAPLGIKAYNVNPAACMTDMWTKISDEIPEYSREMFASMGVTDEQGFARMGNLVYADPDFKRTNEPGLENDLLYASDIAKTVLAFANGTTEYAPGDSVACYPGCTYHISDLYPSIFGGETTAHQNHFFLIIDLLLSRAIALLALKEKIFVVVPSRIGLGHGKQRGPEGQDARLRGWLDLRRGSRATY